jgi:signal transduction histidine kinase
MAGDLTVTSTPGEGARFCLRLPADIPAAGIVNAR